jgi:hypothetical protein
MNAAVHKRSTCTVASTVVVTRTTQCNIAERLKSSTPIAVSHPWRSEPSAMPLSEPQISRFEDLTIMLAMILSRREPQYTALCPMVHVNHRIWHYVPWYMWTTVYGIMSHGTCEPQYMALCPTVHVNHSIWHYAPRYMWTTIYGIMSHGTCEPQYMALCPMVHMNHNIQHMSHSTHEPQYTAYVPQYTWTTIYRICPTVHMNHNIPHMSHSTHEPQYTAYVPQYGNVN